MVGFWFEEWAGRDNRQGMIQSYVSALKLELFFAF